MSAPVLLSVLLGLFSQLPSPQPPAPSDGAWTAVKSVDGIALKRADGLPAPWGMGEGEIEAPVADVARHLLDFASIGRRVRRMSEVRVLERHADRATVYYRLDLPWPLSDRDWIVEYRWAAEIDGVFRIVWWDANDRAPAVRGAMRVAPMRGRWELTPTPAGATRARYVFLAQLGGRLPRSVINETAWKQPLETFRGIRAALGGH
jgi:hypothetical protein